ncbi:RNA methyltransferase [Oculatella sp. LEGE 06141]|uniref:RNA methyltransferase n=1 Tax=Oculatella sp. LEGE 06141 TaxID=1828648 RepID=UPI001882BCAD|nr:RNA methyltransferase [Oculatella sp. LEGE 06141]MBE9181797.1 RNA methyltransferase [Oculatella sp. LEGE 06141]
MSDNPLTGIRIVLVEPAGALNVGAVSRVMKNMGLHRLVLVNPQCDPVGAEARQMAVHAADVLESALTVATLPDALQGCQRAIATTARSRTLEAPLELPKTGLPWLLNRSASGETAEAALIFGPEDRGLSNTELNYAQRFVRIPSNPDYSSLNLAQAVAICCYELYTMATNCQGGEASLAAARSHPGTLPSAARSLNLVSLDALEGYYQQLEALLLKIGYLYPHTATSRMEKFRQLFNRADLSETELAMLRGILSQMEWALKQNPNS